MPNDRPPVFYQGPAPGARGHDPAGYAAWQAAHARLADELGAGYLEWWNAAADAALEAATLAPPSWSSAPAG